MLSPATGSPGRARSARWCARPRIPGGLSMPMGSTWCMRIPHMQRDMVRGTQPAAPEARPRPVNRRQAEGGRRRAPLPPPAFRLPPDARFYLLVYLAAFAVYTAVAWPHTHPPYIDSFYYLDIARNLAQGQGLTEGFVWNYLGGRPPFRHSPKGDMLPGKSRHLAHAPSSGGS